MNFGAELRRLRERRRLTQEQLAENAGLSTNAVSALERGDRRHPYPSTVRALAAALGLTDGELRSLQALVPQRCRGGAAVFAPRQLPPAPRHFTGRERDLSRLTALLAPGPAPASAVVISAIDGTAGVGKTTLALVWAHQVRERFPDGQLYVNLRGYDPGQPVAPAEALDGFLRALNVPVADIPASVADRAALFRSVVADRRVLVVLDNANSAEQVRPLLPGSASCLVVVTSRASLTGLAVRDGAVRINLDRLPVADAVALLRDVAGPERADQEPDAVAELARLCARLPLALQLAGQRAAARPRSRLADVAAELADQAQRLHLLSTGADQFTAIRPVFSWSYDALPDAESSLFRLLGAHPGPDIGVPAAAAIAGVSPGRARVLLDGLTDAHLVEHVGGDRFTLHDLLRAYAGERVEPAERRHALCRLLGYYLHTAAVADRLLHPGRHRSVTDGAPQPPDPHRLTTFAAALEWCETERAGLMAAICAAADAGLDTVVWQLVNNLWSFCYLRKYWPDWIAANQLGLAAAVRSADRNGRARMLNGLAVAYVAVRRTDEAIDCFRGALPLFAATGDRWGEASVLVNLGDAHLGLRDYAAAADYSTRALAVVGELDNPYVEGTALGNLGEAYLGLGRYDKALRNFVEVLALCRRIGHRHGEGMTLIHLGEACLGLGRYDEAREYLAQALDLSRDTADRHGEGQAMRHLGHVYAATHQPDRAHRHWAEALAILTEVGDPGVEELRAELAEYDRAPRNQGVDAGTPMVLS